MDGLILAGGKSTRMGGRHKGNLSYQNSTFMERVIQEFRKETDTVWISYGQDVRERYEGCRIVTDEYLGCGPIGGIHAGLRMCQGEWMMVAACDMPFLKMELYHFLTEALRQADCEEQNDTDGYMGVVPVTEGRIHPLAAIYRKKMEEVLETQIQNQNYRMTEALKKQKILYIDVSENQRIQQMLQNINTISEYEQLKSQDEKKEKKEC